MPPGLHPLRHFVVKNEKGCSIKISLERTAFENVSEVCLRPNNPALQL